MFVVLKKNGEFSKAADELIRDILDRAKKSTNKRIRIHPLEWKRNKGGWCSLSGSGELQNLITVCQFLRLPFSCGNDAPRGGKAGEYIEIRIDYRNKFWRTFL